MALESDMTNLNKDNEIWKPINGASLYLISNHGNVKSLNSESNLKILENGRNQLTVIIKLNSGKYKTFTVARLVASHFLDIVPNRNVVCHIDNNPRNNYYKNLRWGTYLENELDKIANNTKMFGEKNHQSIISQEDVLNIHKMRNEGISNLQIAEKYSLSEKHVSSILTFRTWKHLKDIIKPQNDTIICKKRPFIIKGGSFVDDRGCLKFCNDFNFFGIRRFYQINNQGKNMVRAWHGHAHEGKIFHIISGSILIGAVNMKTDELSKFVISEQGDPKLLWIPPGYANGFMNLTENSSIMIFSTSTVEESMNDDIRFPFDKWNIWQPMYR